MTKRIDLTGQKFSKLTVLQYSHTKNGKAYWLCKCDCGNTKIVEGWALKSGNTKACGCLGLETKSQTGKKNKLNLIGKRFGRLTVLGDSGKRQRRQVMWECKCDCGNITIVRGSALTYGTTVSCGCWRKEQITGPNHHSWKGGISPEYKMARASMDYVYWRHAIFDKYGKRCQVCGQTKGKLCAHHLESFHNNPELRTSEDNGILLCEKCHKNFHHQYGWGNNTREQFNKFNQEYQEVLT